MKTITNKKLKEILNKHDMWLRNEPNGVKADLSGANLYEADLSGADLSGTDLYGSVLCGADLCGANLYGAELCDADLRAADLRIANLCEADFDTNRWRECSTGIHFFITREEAVNYI